MQQTLTSTKSKKNIICLLPLVFLLATCADQVTGPVNDNDSNGDENGDPVDKTLNLKNVGASAEDLLADENYNALIVQVQYMEGADPTAEALDGLIEFLGERVNKTMIELRTDAPLPPGGKETYTLSEIRDWEDEYRTEFNRNDTIAVYYLYLDGGYEHDTDNSFVLGIAHRNTSLTMFQKNIKSVSGGTFQPSQRRVETTVLNHEFGHILGLVGIGYHADHQDEEHGNHCDNKECLMYYTATTDAIGNLIGTNRDDPPPALDPNYIDDLRDKGGK